jgi:hypothetical protein
VDAAQRAARNEEIFRGINARIEHGAELDHLQGLISFHCECANRSCLAQVRLTATVYKAIYADPDRFVVAPAHERPEFERVVERHDAYTVVEKRGEAAATAERLDPRTSRSE